jgi:hypothetical protein
MIDDILNNVFWVGSGERMEENVLTVAGCSRMENCHIRDVVVMGTKRVFLPPFISQIKSKPNHRWQELLYTASERIGVESLPAGMVFGSRILHQRVDTLYLSFVVDHRAWTTESPKSLSMARLTKGI